MAKKSQVKAMTSFNLGDRARIKDLGGLRPLAAAHMHLGAVDAECLDLDDDVARLGLGLGDLFVVQAVESPELLDDDRVHC